MHMKNLSQGNILALPKYRDMINVETIEQRNILALQKLYKHDDTD